MVSRFKYLKAKQYGLSVYCTHIDILLIDSIECIFEKKVDDYFSVVCEQCKKKTQAKIVEKGEKYLIYKCKFPGALAHEGIIRRK